VSTAEEAASERAARAGRLDAEASRMRTVGNPGRATELNAMAAKVRAEAPKSRRAPGRDTA
jgi:hypothetical protein